MTSDIDPVQVQCPVHRVAITPCEEAEVAPLVDHLHANLGVQGSQRFPRGTLTEDGRLDLCKQSLGTDNCLLIAAALKRNTQVRSLMLGTDAIGDAGAIAVAELAVANPHLEVLYMGCNNIGPKGAKALGAALDRTEQNITGLWLKRNPLGPEGAKSIANMLRGNSQLRALDLVNTDLRNAGVRDVVDALCEDNRSLQHLYLSGNGLTPSAAGDLARLLRDAPHIKGLYLSVNQLGDEGAILLADALRSNQTLQFLDLASNGIGIEGARALFSSAKHSSIRELGLGFAPSTKPLGAAANRIGDDGAKLAAELIDASRTLRKLDARGNNITSLGMSSIIAAAKRSQKLCHLITDSRLPDDLIEHLKQNCAQSEPFTSSERELIRSVYR